MEPMLTDEYGNKKCNKCGNWYGWGLGPACQNCCQHDKVELEIDHDGMCVMCEKCLYEIPYNEFDKYYRIIKKAPV
jgi:hypothetical protein